MKKVLVRLIGRSNYFRLTNALHPYRTQLWDIDLILQNYSEKFSDVFLIQIGANDGVYDPIRKFIQRHNWSGILIEPVPYLFNRLVESYEGKEHNLIFRQVAIDARKGSRPIYYISEQGVKALGELNLQGIGSFNPDFYRKFEAKYGKLSEYVVSEEVEVDTLSNVCTEHEVNNVNIIHIDTEGYDYEIIKTIDFNDIEPDIIVFEHIHISRNELDECNRYLAGRGYEIYYYAGDTIAINKKLPVKELKKTKS